MSGLTYQNVVDAMLSSESAVKDIRMIVTNYGANGTPDAPTHAASTSTAQPEAMDVNAVQAKAVTRLCYRKEDTWRKFCIAKKKRGYKAVHYTEEDKDDYIGGIYNVGGVRVSRVPPYEVVVTLNGTPTDMQVDTGASFSLVNERTWRALEHPRPPLQPPPLALRTWTDSPVALLGRATLRVQYKDITRDLDVFVAKGKGRIS
ncbi:uncharacterized protein [Choristoneura fumiferana]|uniref:uncharacterized protein n=1 Tax=Choristoneura fumiferana TaxID=7141 RepID=UPI003D15CADB